jgi:hypothetical protein
MVKRIVLLVAMLAMLALAAAPALANSCANVSRAAPKSTDSSGLNIKGRWVWLPSVEPGAPPIWVFVTPGTEPSAQFLGKPHGNYTNGKTESLLGVSANCDPSKTTSRQHEHGIQSGCE